MECGTYFSTVYLLQLIEELDNPMGLCHAAVLCVLIKVTNE
jgi:hypothetical protein